MRRLLCLGLTILVSQARAQRGPQYEMDYGPFLSGTFGAEFPAGNLALKGVAIRLGDDAAVLYDTELARLAAGWTGGFLVLTGTAYDGSHGPFPRGRGRQWFGSGARPGWATAGSFDDPRPTPHGPLPRDWARYRGLHVHGSDVVLTFSIGGSEVHEHPSLEAPGGMRAIARTLEIAPGDALQLLVCERPGAAATVRPLDGTDAETMTGAAGASYATLRRRHGHGAPLCISRTSGDWTDLAIGAPRDADHADAKSKHGVTVTLLGYGREPTADGAPPAPVPIPFLLDGATGRHEDDGAARIDLGGRPARLVMDLQEVVEVADVRTYSWHRRGGARQRYDLWGVAADAMPATDGELAPAGWVKIQSVDTGSLGGDDKHGARIAAADGGLGRYRFLLWDVPQAGGRMALQEIDVALAGAPAPLPPDEMSTVVRLIGAPAGARWRATGDGRLVLEIPPRTRPLRCKLLHWDGPTADAAAFVAASAASPAPRELAPLRRGGPARWGAVATRGDRAADDAAYVVDTLTVPYDNPWNARMRIGGLDFFSDGRAAVSTWNGDVWVISGIDDDLDELTWTRFAAGLFDPLGLRIVDDVVHTLGRDQITRLHDLNDDGEADRYECFNNDVLMTKNFHEFAFDLQTDAEGNFYFSKGGPVRPGGRGFDELVAHHGCVLRVRPDGSELEVYATGLRAPNGIGVGPDGQVTSGDNEGTWTPRCRLNWIRPNTFCGCLDTAHRDPPPELYDLPVCWMPMEVDNSSGGQVWVTSEQWGPFQGDLLHLSYGTSSLFKVLLQEVDGVMQGGVVRFPLSFASSCMRARFHPIDQQLYLCGLKGWQTNAAQLSAVHRVRYTGGKPYLPAELAVLANGVQITFTDPIDRDLAEDVESYAVEQWNYIWSERYGSPEISTVDGAADRERALDDWNGYRNRDSVVVHSAVLSEDGKTVFLAIDGLQPVMQMRIQYDLDAADGASVRGEIHHSIHRVPAARGPAPRD